MSAATMGASSVLMTDGDAFVVDLATQNIKLNGLSHICSAQVLQWESPELGGSYDVVVASDVLYHMSAVKPLVDVLLAHSRASSTSVNCSTAGGWLAPIRPSPSIYMAISHLHDFDDETTFDTSPAIAFCKAAGVLWGGPWLVHSTAAGRLPKRRVRALDYFLAHPELFQVGADYSGDINADEVFLLHFEAEF
jgi:hypothetical protein